jgi:hypothetical protein
VLSDHWNHVTGIFDGTSLTRMYVNNSLACSTNVAATYTGSSSDLLLGSQSGSDSWKGSVGSVRLYSSGDQAKATTNYNATKDVYNEYIDFTELGLKLWVKADSLFGYSDGDPVCFWRDLSGNNNHLRSTAQANCPTYYSNLIGAVGNKKPILQFNGTSNRLEFSTAMTDVRTLIIVHKWNGLTADYRGLLGHSSVFHWITGANGDVGTDKMASTAYTSPNVIGGSAYLNRGAAQTPQTIVKPTTYAIYTSKTIGNTSADHLSSDRGIANRFFWGDIAEVLIFNTALGDSDRSKIEDYLAQKYAIP